VMTTDFGKLFETDAAVSGKVRLPIVEGRVRGATSANVLKSAVVDVRRGVTRAEDLRPGSQMQSCGGSDTPALPAGKKYVLTSKASVICAVTAECGPDDKL